MPKHAEYDAQKETNRMNEWHLDEGKETEVMVGREARGMTPLFMLMENHRNSP